MLTYNNLLKIDPMFGQADPKDVAEFIRTQYYPDADPDDFYNRFSEESQITADDIRKIDNRFEGVDDDALFGFVKDKLYTDVPEEQMPEIEAVFKGKAKDRTWGEVGSDTVGSWVAGANSAVAGTTRVSERTYSALLDPVNRGMDYVSEGLGMGKISQNMPWNVVLSGEKALSSLTEQQAEDASQGQSEGLRGERAIVSAQQDERKLEGDGVLSRGAQAAGDYLTNPALLGDTVVQSLPAMALGGAAAKGAGLLATAGGATTAEIVAAATAAGIGMEALTEGGNAAIEAGKTVKGMSFKELEAKSDNYNEYLSQDMKPEEARDQTARDAELRAMAIAVPASAIFAKLGAPLETKLLTGYGGAVDSVKGGVGQTLEEIGQEGVGQFATNVGVLAGDRDTQLDDNVVEAAGAGAAVGGVMGAAGGTVNEVTNRVSGLQPTIKAANDVLKRARAGEALTDKDIDLARRIYPSVKDELFDASREAHARNLADAQMDVDLAADPKAQVESELGEASDFDFSDINNLVDERGGYVRPEVKAEIEAFEADRANRELITGQNELNFDGVVGPPTPEVKPAKPGEQLSLTLEGGESVQAPDTQMELDLQPVAPKADQLALDLDGVEARKAAERQKLAEMKAQELEARKLREAETGQNELDFDRDPDPLFEQTEMDLSDGEVTKPTTPLDDSRQLEMPLTPPDEEVKGEQIAMNFNPVQVTAAGKPFTTEKSAKAAAQLKQKKGTIADFEVVKEGDGYGYRELAQVDTAQVDTAQVELDTQEDTGSILNTEVDAKPPTEITPAVEQALEDAEVDVEVFVKETGETKKVKQNALKAVQELDVQIDKYRSLLKCLRS
jgi:hypothetical protein